MRVLFVSSEVFPLVKTGGLADVSAALPAALAELGADVRVLMPAYRGIRARVPAPRRLGSFAIAGHECSLWESTLGGVRLWLLEAPALYDRPGDPYHDARGVPHPDNAIRFGVFGAAAARIALDQVGAGWAADVLHVNDWQGALACAWTAHARPMHTDVRVPRAQDAQERPMHTDVRVPQERPGPRIVFTIHNLAYQGRFARDSFDALGLPGSWWHLEGVEFWGGWQFMKAGLNFADVITTVSPTYAREIQTAEHGAGLDGVLRRHAGRLHGVLNGIDDRVWNPAGDPHLVQTYSVATVAAGKRANKLALQEALGLVRDASRPLVAFIGRLTEQKGSDLVLEAAEVLTQMPAQYVILGAGDRAQESEFSDWAAREPGQVAVHIGYDEALAHQIEAAADAVLMPSRFEPCGLNQMYSQQYGALPVVRRTGGLADTVDDATPAALQARSATGVLFDHADAGGVLYGVGRALDLLADPAALASLQFAGMTRDFSWSRAARRYLELYRA